MIPHKNILGGVYPVYPAHTRRHDISFFSPAHIRGPRPPFCCVPKTVTAMWTAMLSAKNSHRPLAAAPPRHPIVPTNHVAILVECFDLIGRGVAVQSAHSAAWGIKVEKLEN